MSWGITHVNTWPQANLDFLALSPIMPVQTNNLQEPALSKPLPLISSCAYCRQDKDTIVDGAIAENMIRNSGAQFPTNGEQKLGESIAQLIVHYLHERPAAKKAVSRAQAESMREVRHKAKSELLVVMKDKYRWIQREPRDFDQLVEWLYAIARIGPIERHLKQYDILAFLELWKACELVRPGGSKKNFKDKIAQRFHKILCPTACCLVRAIAATLTIRDEYLYKCTLRQELMCLFGAWVTTTAAKNGNFVIRKRTFELPMFRQVVSAVVGIEEVATAKSRDEIELILRQYNYSDLPQVDDWLCRYEYYMQVQMMQEQQRLTQDSRPRDTQMDDVSCRGGGAMFYSNDVSRAPVPTISVADPTMFPPTVASEDMDIDMVDMCLNLDPNAGGFYTDY